MVMTWNNLRNISTAFTTMSSKQFANVSLEEDAKLLIKLNDEAAYDLVPIFVTCGILMLVGIAGNCLVVHVYLRKMQSSAKRTFILALAWLDLCVCAIVIPCELFDLRNQVLFSQDSLCKGMRFLEYTTVLSAGFVLVSVSFERYYFLCKAFEEFSVKKAKLVCLACICCAMLVATPSAIFAGSKTRHFPGINSTGSECSLNSEHNFDETFKRFYYYFLTVIFLGCVIVFIVLYSMIGHLLWKYHSGRLNPTNMEQKTSKGSNLNLSTPNLNTAINDPRLISTDHSSGHSHSSGTSKCSHWHIRIHGKRCLKSAGTVLVFFSVTVMFVISFLPHIVMRIMMFLDVQFEFDARTNSLLYNFVVRSYLISNASNPFIYSIFNRAFRHELKKTFKRCGFCGEKSIHRNRLLKNGNKSFV